MEARCSGAPLDSCCPLVMLMAAVVGRGRGRPPAPPHGATAATPGRRTLSQGASGADVTAAPDPGRRTTPAPARCSPSTATTARRPPPRSSASSRRTDSPPTASPAPPPSTSSTPSRTTTARPSTSATPSSTTATRTWAGGAVSAAHRASPMPCAPCGSCEAMRHALGDQPITRHQRLPLARLQRRGRWRGGQPSPATATRPISVPARTPCARLRPSMARNHGFNAHPGPRLPGPRTHQHRTSTTVPAASGRAPQLRDLTRLGRARHDDDRAGPVGRGRRSHSRNRRRRS